EMTSDRVDHARRRGKPCVEHVGADHSRETFERVELLAHRFEEGAAVIAPRRAMGRDPREDCWHGSKARPFSPRRRYVSLRSAYGRRRALVMRDVGAMNGQFPPRPGRGSAVGGKMLLSRM